MNRIDHTQHAHPATPAARKACRKQYRTAKADQDRRDAELERREREARFDADMARVDAEKVQVATPFLSRAIQVSFKLKSGERCSVVFDKYGTNKELFELARRNSWSADRTVAQACSEAINAVIRANGPDSIEYHTVRTVD